MICLQKPFGHILNKTRIVLILCLVIAILESCWAPKQIVTTANVTQPVLVGKVCTIGGKKQNDTLLHAGSEFTSQLVNSELIWSAGYIYGYSTLREGSNKMDSELLKIIDAKQHSDVFKVNSIDFSIAGGYWLFAYSTYTRCKLNGYFSYPIKNE